MRILFLHNRYLYRGGEDESREQELRMLRAHGDEVFEQVLDNAAIAGKNLVRIGLQSVWNTAEAETVKHLLQHTGAQVLKVDNFYPLASPSVFAAAKSVNVATVLSIRNYRLVCPSANVYRDHKTCKLCLGKRFATPAIRHRCYRDSYAQSAAVVASNAFSHFRGVWANSVDRYVAVSSFVRDQLVQGGFPAHKIVIKPNFIADSGLGDGSGGFALYVGRLTEEKGVPSLLQAWQKPDHPIPLTIIGDGPLEPVVQQAAQDNPRIHFLGRKPLDEVGQYLGQAAMLIFPSVWLEPFGRTIIEAFAKGTPVVAARTDSVRAMIQEGRTGLLYRAGDPADLASTVRHLATHPEQLQAMRAYARQRYLTAYTEADNYQQLTAIFRSAIAANQHADATAAPASR